MNERIEIEVKYSPDEYVRGMIFSQRKNSFHKYNFFFTFVSGLIGFIGVHYFINRGEIILNSDFLLKFLFVLMILIPVAYVFKDFSPASERFFKKHYDSTALLQETYKISFDAEGINSESKSFTSKLGWNAIIEAFQTDEDFHFFIARNTSLFISKRAIRSEAQQNQLIELAERKLADRAKF